ncbi:TetR/AcrR family transcriptional regulator [Streptomyces roseicoloratus]|uniref:TetR/AcrR family transcriptional regulator n=1 Tax=Streptomyces roseicoloratus TaxID=2508722 RepID=A0ABY9S2K9_9ACTN|nr:TetR/AcrR family transcriptional regulator [Streptomyces roseicoloratus]WMX48259.1 TetR/AcrR family transcriptional regulator [Streptomyces roseicoloratus]
MTTRTSTSAAAGTTASASERLVEATRELLWERGYVGTSPKAIQQAAGAGQGSMYHHFTGKPDLALAAIRRTADELRAGAERVLGGPGSAYARIEAYLLRERDVLRGCPVGRLTMDPDVVVSDELRAPVDETLHWLRGRLAGIVQEGLDDGEFEGPLSAEEIASTVVATVQGGYVLARASGSPAAFDTAVRGLLALLSARTRH